MTLLLASVGFAAQSPTARWWFPGTQTDQIRRQYPRGANGSASGKRQQARRRLATIVAVLSAFVVWAALALTLINWGAAGFFSLHHRVTRAPSDIAEDLFPAVLRQSSEAQRGWFAQDEPPFLYAISLAIDVKTLLGHERVAMLDAIRSLPPALDRKIALAFPGSSFPDNKTRATKTEARLARVTVYWPEEGDYYTRARRSSSGVRLRDGHCAVDPKVIPYGTMVRIPGIGPLIAVDTGSAVVSRRAARQTGRTREQRNAIVVDVYCSSRAKAKALVKRIKHFAVVTWQRPVRQSKL